MTALAGVVALLQAAGIRFGLIGAAAMAAHGVSRATADIDFMTTNLRVLQPAFWQIDAGVDLRRGDADDPLAGVVRISASGEPVLDVIVGRHRWQERLLDLTRVVPLEGVDVPVVDRTGLILLKLYAGGPQDAWDIQQLLAAAPEDTAPVVERVLPELPADAAHLWRRIRAEEAGTG